ncbi:MAG: GntR family transcriptional regulator [Candidatus Rokuibacteriota bacterium]
MSAASPDVVPAIEVLNTELSRIGPTPGRERGPGVPIQHENLDDKIYAQLKGLLATRQLPPGQRIVPERLAQQMGVSRTPLLAALKRLAQERLVEWVSRRGIYIRRCTKREMARLFELREVLEGLAARLAATRVTAEEVGRLVGLFQGLDVSPTAAAVRRYIERDRHFHGRLVELAGSPPLAQAMDTVNMLVFAYQDGLVRPAAETVREHWPILDALGRRDPDGAEAAMRHHIRRSTERLAAEADMEDAATVSDGVDARPGLTPDRSMGGQDHA